MAKQVFQKCTYVANVLSSHCNISRNKNLKYSSITGSYDSPVLDSSCVRFALYRLKNSLVSGKQNQALAEFACFERFIQFWKGHKLHVQWAGGRARWMR